MNRFIDYSASSGLSSNLPPSRKVAAVSWAAEAASDDCWRRRSGLEATADMSAEARAATAITELAACWRYGRVFWFAAIAARLAAAFVADSFWQRCYSDDPRLGCYWCSSSQIFQHQRCYLVNTSLSSIDSQISCRCSFEPLRPHTVARRTVAGNSATGRAWMTAGAASCTSCCYCFVRMAISQRRLHSCLSDRSPGRYFEPWECFEPVASGAP